ncbi:MAG: hypothetical protein IPP74_15400 [Alphaproteobacteria bacterium]|nr:hypothetical protein [Alphaproteobacteria bacterium]
MNRLRIMKTLNQVGELPSLEEIQRKEELLKKAVIDRVLEHLLRHPGNYYEAGKAAGISREAVIRLKELNPALFKENEDRYYDGLEEDLLNYGRYGFLKDKPEFDPATAKMILERRRSKEWNIPKRVGELQGATDTGESRIVEEFFSKMGLEQKEEEPNED